MFKLFSKFRDVRFNIHNVLHCVYEQQRFLADADKSFVRVLPISGQYTRDSVKEAIYYAQCADIEIYEYQMAKPKDKLDEAVDIAIFTLNVLAYLGCSAKVVRKIKINPIKSTKQVLVRFHKLLSTVLYSHIDYKQWKFPVSDKVVPSYEVEELLLKLANVGLALAAYEACKQSSKHIQPETILMNAIIHKMQVSRVRATAEVSNHLVKA